MLDEIWQADMKVHGLMPLIKGKSDHEKDNFEGYLTIPVKCERVIQKDKDFPLWNRYIPS